MIILSKGYKKPQTGDFGSIWFDAIEDNTDLVNLHNHDGINGEKIPSSSLTAVVSSVLSGAFTLQPSGEYRATVTIPVGGQIDTLVVTFRDPTTKQNILLKTEKLSATQIYVYTSFLQDYEVIFGL